MVFTFSKRRCEENAASMPNTDLCTAAEKSEVHVTIERSLTRLRGLAHLLILVATADKLYRIRQEATSDRTDA